MVDESDDHAATSWRRTPSSTPLLSCALAAVIISCLIHGMDRATVSSTLALFLLLIALTFVARCALDRNWGGAIGGIVGFVILIALSLPILSVAIWDGYKSIPLQFLVLDAKQLTTVAGATVRLRPADSGPYAEYASSKNAVQGMTSADGTITLNWKFPSSGREGWTEHSGCVIFSFSNTPLFVEVSAPGFVSQVFALESLTGKSRDIDSPVPPPIWIVLAPSKPANK